MKALKILLDERKQQLDIFEQNKELGNPNESNYIVLLNEAIKELEELENKDRNVVAFEIANEWGADEELFEQLYLDLETYYKEEVLHKGEVPIFDKPDFFKCNVVN